MLLTIQHIGYVERPKSHPFHHRTADSRSVSISRRRVPLQRRRGDHVILTVPRILCKYVMCIAVIICSGRHKVDLQRYPLRARINRERGHDTEWLGQHSDRDTGCAEWQRQLQVGRQSIGHGTVEARDSGILTPMRRQGCKIDAVLEHRRGESRPHGCTRSMAPSKNNESRIFDGPGYCLCKPGNNASHQLMLKSTAKKRRLVCLQRIRYEDIRIQDQVVVMTHLSERANAALQVQNLMMPDRACFCKTLSSINDDYRALLSL